MWWTIILDKVFGGVTDYFATKQVHIQKLEEKKMDLEVAKVTSQITMVEKQQDTDNSIDMYTIKDRGWKDDIITYTVVSPFIILLFNPLLSMLFGYDYNSVVVAMSAGFKALEDIPEPMWYGLLIVMSDTFGLRIVLRQVFEILTGKLKSKIGGNT